jgi:hypothetical protein
MLAEKKEDIYLLFSHIFLKTGVSWAFLPLFKPKFLYNLAFENNSVLR